MIARLLACDYDAIYMRPLTTDLDPAGNLDYWLSSGSAHLWNMQQDVPATEWEKQIDTLMHEQSTTLDVRRRQEIFVEVQKVFAENVPGSLLRLAPPLLRTQPSRPRCRAVDSASAGPVERRFVQRDERALMVRFLARRLIFAARPHRDHLLIGANAGTSRPGRHDVPARTLRLARGGAEHAGTLQPRSQPGLAVVAVGRVARAGSTSATPFSTTGRSAPLVARAAANTALLGIVSLADGHAGSVSRSASSRERDPERCR